MDNFSHLAGILQFPGGNQIGSPLGNPAVSNIGGVISAVLPFIYTIAGILLLIYLLISGIRYLTSGGNPQAMSDAREHMYAALIGFAIVFGSFALLRLAETIFHFRVTSAIPAAHAAAEVDIGQSFRLGGNSIRDFIPALTSTGRLTSVIVRLLFVGASVIFTFILIIGALRYLFSGGDEKNLAGARSQITAGLIGILIAFAAFAMVRFIQFFTGVPILD